MPKNVLDYDTLNKEYLNNKIGNGCCADCYLTDNKKVIKIIKDKYRDFDSIIKNSKYLSDVFVLPEYILYSENLQEFVGYTMEYVDGYTIEELPMMIKIRNYIEAIKEVEEEIAKFSSYRISLLDISPRNMMYTKNDTIKIIDTDFYEHNSDEKHLYAYNMIRFARAITLPLLNIFAYDFSDDKMNLYSKKLADSRMLVSDYIKLLTDELDRNNIEADNILQVRYGLKLLREKRGYDYEEYY